MMVGRSGGLLKNKGRCRASDYSCSAAVPVTTHAALPCQ